MYSSVVSIHRKQDLLLRFQKRTTCLRWLTLLSLFETMFEILSNNRNIIDVHKLLHGTSPPTLAFTRWLVISSDNIRDIGCFQLDLRRDLFSIRRRALNSKGKAAVSSAGVSTTSHIVCFLVHAVFCRLRLHQKA